MEPIKRDVYHYRAWQYRDGSAYAGIEEELLARSLAEATYHAKRKAIGHLAEKGSLVRIEYVKQGPLY